MKVFGIPVKIDPSFLVIGLLLASSRLSRPVLLVEWLLVIFVSILVHELGHAFAGRAFGLEPRIQLYSMGGLTSWTEAKRLSPKQHIAISLAGPAAGFLFGAVIFLLASSIPGIQDSRFNRVAFDDLLWVNWGWGIFNLLPVLPLDGGNVVGSLEEWVTKRPGGLVARVVSLVVAAGVAAWALSIGSIWIGLLMGLFAWNNGTALYQQLQGRRDQPLRSALDQAWDAYRRQEGAVVVRQAQEVFQSARTDRIKQEALQLLVRGYILEGNLAQAEEELHRLEAWYGPAPSLEAWLYFQAQDWTRALPLLEAIFKASPSPESGELLVRALVGAGRIREAWQLCQDPRLASRAEVLSPLLQAHAFQAGEFEVSAEAGQRAFELERRPDWAYNVACAYARMGRTDEALAWLSRAVDAGYDDPEAMAADADLDALKERPEFESLVNQLRESRDRNKASDHYPS